MLLQLRAPPRSAAAPPCTCECNRPSAYERAARRDSAQETDLFDGVLDEPLHLLYPAFGRKFHRRRKCDRQQLVLIAKRCDKAVVNGIDDDRPLGGLENGQKNYSVDV